QRQPDGVGQGVEQRRLLGEAGGGRQSVRHATFPSLHSMPDTASVLRPKETDVSSRTLYRRANAFDAHGLRALLAEEESEHEHRVSAPLRRLIHQLKA